MSTLDISKFIYCNSEGENVTAEYKLEINHKIGSTALRNLFSQMSVYILEFWEKLFELQNIKSELFFLQFRTDWFSISNSKMTLLKWITSNFEFNFFLFVLKLITKRVHIFKFGPFFLKKSVVYVYILQFSASLQTNYKRTCFSDFIVLQFWFSV